MALELRPAPKGYSADVHRLVAPEETVRRARATLRKGGLLQGLVVERLDNRDVLGVPVYRVYAPGDAEREHGKGLNRAEALASGLMEYVERFSASHWHYRGLASSSWEELGERAVSYAELVPERLLAEGPREALDRLEMLWCPAWSLTRRREALVPAHLVHTHVPFMGEDRVCTNGLGAGNTLEEALVHAVCEAVERHREEVVNRNRMPAPAIELASVEGPDARAAVDALSSRGFELHLADYTGELGIPTVAGLAVHPDEVVTGPGWCLAHGTHPDPEVAVVRVLTELCQTRAALLADYDVGPHQLAARRGSMPRGVSRMLEERREARAVPLPSLPRLATDDLREDLEGLVRRLSAQGFEAWAVDITHPSLGVPCVRAVVRDLQPTLHNRRVVPEDMGLRISRHLDRRTLFEPSVYTPDAEWPSGGVRPSRRGSRRAGPGPAVAGGR